MPRHDPFEPDVQCDLCGLKFAEPSMVLSVLGSRPIQVRGEPPRAAHRVVLCERCACRVEDALNATEAPPAVKVIPAPGPMPLAIKHEEALT